VILIGVVIVLGFWPGLIQTITDPAAQTLVNMFGGPAMAGLPLLGH
jgi:hypothetical protein